MIYVYGVLSARPEQAELAGLDDAPVECRDVAGLAVALSRHPAIPQASDESVLRHAQVVEELAQKVPVLPARFGVAFADEDALEQSVTERRAELSADLDRVRGCVELGLRVLVPEPAEPPTAAASGTDYLRARQAVLAERERLAADVHDRLAAHARSTTRSPVTGDVILSSAYLVPDESVASFRNALEQLEGANPELTVLCTGPWPAYSFAGGSG